MAISNKFNSTTVALPHLEDRRWRREKGVNEAIETGSKTRSEARTEWRKAALSLVMTAASAAALLLATTAVR